MTSLVTHVNPIFHLDKSTLIIVTKKKKKLITQQVYMHIKRRQNLENTHDSKRPKIRKRMLMNNNVYLCLFGFLLLFSLFYRQ